MNQATLAVHRLALLTVALTVGALLAPALRAEVDKEMDAKIRATDRPEAPEFEGASAWINTEGKALKVADLKGKVVLLDFWTFG